MTSEPQHTSSTPTASQSAPRRHWPFGTLLIGFGAGALVTAALAWAILPGLMIVTHESKLPFDETVATIQQELVAAGWASPGTINLNKSMAKNGVDMDQQVRVIQLCKAPYAKAVLTTDRYASAMMPCAIAVWEADDGTVHISKLNTGLVGRMFGGAIAEVMGGKVGPEEERIIASVTR